MSKIKIAEIFHSLQGEGRYVGHPSVFVRTFGCNFKCQSFGMPRMNHDHVEYEKSREAEDIAKIYKENPERWKNYEELPIVTTGCDSYASWHPAFKDLSPVLDTDVIIEEADNCRKENHPFPKNDGTTHLVITGGEPLLGWQRAYPDLIDGFIAKGYKEITFETNGTQEITDAFADYLLVQQLSATKTAPHYTFSVSAKLPSSGEDKVDALKPDVVASYQAFGQVYLKFVVATEDDARDAVEYVREYRKAGFTGDVYVMPCGGVEDLYNLNAPKVAEIAMRYGWIYSPRLQVDLWKNEWGT